MPINTALPDEMRSSRLVHRPNAPYEICEDLSGRKGTAPAIRSRTVYIALESVGRTSLRYSRPFIGRSAPGLFTKSHSLLGHFLSALLRNAENAPISQRG